MPKLDCLDLGLEFSGSTDLPIEMHPEVCARIDGMVVSHVNYYRGCPEFSHRLIYSTEDGITVSYLYFVVKRSSLELFGAFTAQDFRKKGLMSAQLNYLFNTPWAAHVESFETLFEPFETNAGALGIHNHLVHWFEHFGPKGKLLWVNSYKCYVGSEKAR